jgi:hypothetical protein
MSAVGHSVGFSSLLDMLDECHVMRATRLTAMYYSYADSYIKEEGRRMYV